MTAPQVPATPTAPLLPNPLAGSAPGVVQQPPPHPIIGRAPPTLGLNLRTLLDEMVAKGASDLHIVAGENPKLRIDGEMQSASSGHMMSCLLYTSDAADERSSVDLG